MITIEKRQELFWNKTAAGLNSCIIWTGAVAGNGYGTFWMGDRNRNAHIVAWYWDSGTWPDKGMELDHTCRTPRCVNVKHLVLGTRHKNQVVGVNPKWRRDPALCAKEIHDWETNKFKNGNSWNCRPCYQAARRVREKGA